MILWQAIKEYIRAENQHRLLNLCGIANSIDFKHVPVIM